MSRSGYIELTFVVEPEPPYFVSTCVELDVASCGDTEQEALEMLTDAVLLYLNTLSEYGECKQVLRDAKVVIHRAPVVTVQPSANRKAIVPLDLLECAIA